jgi:EmrB/QacA subfamily drug resistance transporter
MLNKAQSNWFALIGISIAGFLGCLDLTIVNTALPAIQNDLNISVTQLQWVMTILLLALTAFMVISGKLADLYGRRLCLYSGMILFALSSIGVGFSPNIHYLIGFRFLQGLSIAFLYTAPVAIIPSIFPEHRHGRATGLLIGANGLGLAIGPVIGGLIVSTLGWRWIFFINPPIILISFLFCWKRLIESKSNTAIRKIDWYGFILLIIAVPAFILALVQGETWGWWSTPIIVLFLLAIIGLIIFYYVENKVPAPIIEFHLLANRIFLVGLTANFALAFFYAVDFFLIPLYLHYIHGQSGYQIGLSLLPATFMVAALSSLTGRIIDKKGPKGVLCVGLLLFVISGFLQSQFGVHTPVYYILFSYLMFGVGWACILSPSIVAALSSVPKESAGVAMGTIGTLHNLGGAIGLAIGTLIYNLLSKSALLSLLKQHNVQSGPWVDQAIANTENAVQILQKNTQLDIQTITAFFQHYFLNGYQGAMWLLVVSSLLAFFVVFIGLKNKKSTGEKIQSTIH